jgi:murein DD-endopeptidase MepM/ murein hydrolase activator NlpD
MLLTACTTSKRQAIDKISHIKKLEEKLNVITKGDFGDIILKYDLLNLHQNSNLGQCPISQIFPSLHQQISDQSFLGFANMLEIKIDEKNHHDSKALLKHANEVAGSKISKLKNYARFHPLFTYSNLEEEEDAEEGSLDVFSLIDQIDKEVSSTDLSYRYLVELRKINRLLEVVPLNLPIYNYQITSSFGPRQDPISKVTKKHSGIDLVAKKDKAIFATKKGLVEFAGFKGKYGNLIILKHDNDFSTYYAHLDKIYVKQGELVREGQKIALQGNSGRSTKDHLHYEIRHTNIAIDPKMFLKLGSLCTAP